MELKKVELLKKNLQSVIVGKEDVMEYLLIGLLAQGHVLLEDVPGTGKTVLAKSMAKSLECDFNRIQFTPDILPSDITGMSVYNQKELSFEFRPGPAFTNILLADEINRATPRTQAALLECMEERQITMDGTTYALKRPFLVLATQNPIETQGTFPLPEAQLDRFLIKTSMGYPTTEEALAILDRFISNDPLGELEPVMTADEIVEAQNELPNVRMEASIRAYIVALAEATRKAEGVVLGVSPRGTLALMRAAQARAMIHGRDYVIPEDVKVLAKPVLSHRIICRSQSILNRDPSGAVMDSVLNHVEVPTERPEVG